MQGMQLLNVFSMSVHIGPVHYTASYSFHSVDTGYPECSCLRTAFLSFVGTTTLFTNLRHSSMMDKESLCHLNCWRPPVRSGGYEYLKNLHFLYCWVVLSFLFNLCFNQLFGLVGRVFTNGLEDLGSISGCVIPKTLRMVFDISLLNTQQYKVRIKGKGD